MYLNVSGDFAFNQDLYLYGMLISQFGGSALNLFTLFVIYYYNPQELTAYKWFLFLYQFFSTILDFAMDTLARPIFFFPYMAGTCTGLLRTVFNVPTFWVYVVLMSFGGVCVHFICFVPLFFRWQVLLDESSKLKLTKRGQLNYHILTLTFGITSFVGFLAMPYEPREKALADFKKHFPEDAILVDIDGFYVVNGWNRPAIVITSNCCTLGWLMVLIVLLAYISTDCIKILNQTRSHMSQRTREMHIRFLKNLFFQVSIPMLFIEIPVLLWLFLMALDIRFPDLNNITVLCTCMHGAIGSIFVFYLNPLYLKCIKTSVVYTFRKHILRLPENRLINVSAVAPTTDLIA